MDIKKELGKLVAEANFSLRPDVLSLLRKAYASEANRKAKQALGWLLENATIAKRERIAICQDTGLPVVFVEAGRGVRVDSCFIEDIKKGIAQGYENNYLRASIVDPLKRGKPGYDGALLHMEFVSGFKGLRISILPKGFGSENKSRLKMFNPTASMSSIEDFIVESVKIAGPEACPPYVIGVGVGSTSDGALLLAKKALLERLDKPNKDSLLHSLEKRLLTRINKLKIGAMGLGGSATCLAVKVKTAPTHIAGLPVGINISCHALRSATVNIKV